MNNLDYNEVIQYYPNVYVQLSTVYFFYYVYIQIVI